jgi:hypothetical protein
MLTEIRQGGTETFEDVKERTGSECVDPEHWPAQIAERLWEESAERELVGWFRYHRRMGRLPAEPFWLMPGVQVCRPQKRYAELVRAAETYILGPPPALRPRWRFW